MSNSLIFNVVLYLGAFLILKRKRSSRISRFVVLLYFVLAVASILTNNIFFPNNINHPLLPFIYLFICLMVLVFPLTKFETISDNPPSNKLMALLIIMIIFSVLRLPNIISNFSIAITNAIADSDFLFETYNNNMSHYINDLGTGGFNYQIIILNSLDKYIPFFLVYYLTLPKKNIWVTIGLVLGSFIAPLHGLVIAQRGVIVNTVFSFVLSYLIFSHRLSAKAKRWIVTFGGSFLVGITLLFVLISVSRFSRVYSGDGNVVHSMVNYAGQPMLNFDEKVLDAGGVRYGDRTFPLFKKMLFMDVSPTYASRIIKYSNLKINESKFYTLVGDFVLDYGAVLGFIIIVFISLFFRQLISGGGNIRFHNAFAVYVLGYMLLCGWHLYPFSDYGGNLSIIIAVLLFVYFKKRN